MCVFRECWHNFNRFDIYKNENDFIKNRLFCIPLAIQMFIGYICTSWFRNELFIIMRRWCPIQKYTKGPTKHFECIKFTFRLQNTHLKQYRPNETPVYDGIFIKLIFFLSFASYLLHFFRYFWINNDLLIDYFIKLYRHRSNSRLHIER